MVAFNRRHFWRTNCSASTANVDHAAAIVSIPNRPVLNKVDRLDLSRALTRTVDAFEQFLGEVARDGTVENIIYFLVPELPTIAGVAALRPGLLQACEASLVPCHFLDLQPLWKGHSEYMAPENGIQASEAGARVIADSIWAIMKDHCIAQ
jgi:hypothetical protein